MSYDNLLDECEDPIDDISSSEPQTEPTPRGAALLHALPGQGQGAVQEPVVQLGAGVAQGKHRLAPPEVGAGDLAVARLKRLELSRLGRLLYGLVQGRALADKLLLVTQLLVQGADQLAQEGLGLGRRAAPPLLGQAPLLR